VSKDATFEVGLFKGLVCSGNRTSQVLELYMDDLCVYQALVVRALPRGHADEPQPIADLKIKGMV
jgi:hypothetical protein